MVGNSEVTAYRLEGRVKVDCRNREQRADAGTAQRCGRKLPYYDKIDSLSQIE